MDVRVLGHYETDPLPASRAMGRFNRPAVPRSATSSLALPRLAWPRPESLQDGGCRPGEVLVFAHKDLAGVEVGQANTPGGRRRRESEPPTRVAGCLPATHCQVGLGMHSHTGYPVCWHQKDWTCRERSATIRDGQSKNRGSERVTAVTVNPLLFRSPLGRHVRRPRLAALESTLAPERDSGGVFTRFRVDGLDIPHGLTDQLEGESVRIGWSLARAVRHSPHRSVGPPTCQLSYRPSGDVRVEIAEGLVIGPDDKLVVRVKDLEFWDEESTESFNDHLRQVLGDRYIIIVGDVEIAKVAA